MIEISFGFTGSSSTAMNVTAAVFQDSTASALTGSVCQEVTTGPAQRATVTWTFKVAPGSTTPRTYKLRVGPDAGIFYVNGDGSGNRLMGGAESAFITAKEVPNS
jgi:hypothetical protein